MKDFLFKLSVLFFVFMMIVFAIQSASKKIENEERIQKIERELFPNKN